MAGRMAVGSFKSKTTHMGAAHADDLLYLFGMPFDFLPDFLLPQNKQDLKLRRLMVDLWANFAATHKVLLIAKIRKRENCLRFKTCHFFSQYPQKKS